MVMVNEYLDYTKKWEREYGEKTLVLMQVGSFFEAYGLLDKDNNIYGSNITAFAEICEMTISRKSNCVGKARVVMAGFGLAQLEKYIKKMQEVGYTIAVYTQDSPSKNTSRSLHTIFSPGTYFSNDTKELSNNITCIWIQYSPLNLITPEQITIGISNIDIYTGKSSIFEFSKEYHHNPTTYDELERYISIYNPNECIIISNLDSNTINDIINYTSINSNKIHKIYINNEIDKTKSTSSKEESVECSEREVDVLVKNAEKQIYQQEIINKFYNNTSANSESLFNSLGSYCIAIQSFIFLLDFIYKHNPNLVNNIAEPIFENYTNRLILANHSLKQLNIISDNRYSGKLSCVSNLLNNCITSMGKRKFQYNLLNPTTDITYLNKSYNITEHALANDWKLYRSTLMNDIRDIEKIRRKLIMKKMSPKDFTILYSNFSTISTLYKTCKNDPVIMEYLNEQKIGDVDNDCKIYSKNIEKHLNLSKSKFIDDITHDKLNSFDINNVFFINKGLDNKLDACFKKTVDCRQQLECIRKYLSDLIMTYEKTAKTTEFVKIHETAKMDAILLVTKRRSTFLKKAIEKSKLTMVELIYISNFSNQEEVYLFNLSDLQYISHGNNPNSIIISSKDISKISSQINTSKSDLILDLEIFFYKFMNNFIEYDLHNIISFVVNIDLIQCKCFIANEYNYSKPSIVDNTKSFFDIKGIRHCLIEHLNTRELYITNDLILGKGKDKDKDKDGLLLYGTNAVGKTCLIKSIGIAIIMAQAGLYVPCTSLSFYPYNTIFTRILGNDNIFKGLSTFAVEMSELRIILQDADKYSLILGDELCSGTESDSALSIFISGLEVLHERNSTFLFATHFHEIVKYDEIIDLKQLEMYHMTVIYDTQNNKLIYDRKLKLGSGDSMYGLEVCKSLNLPSVFLSRAHDLRMKYNNLYKNILSNSVSKYNSKKIKNICELCNMNIGTEIHHLEYQKGANDNNYICNDNLNFNKNHAANLINICEKCHKKIHKSNNKLTIKKTSDGYEIDYNGKP